MRKYTGHIAKGQAGMVVPAPPFFGEPEFESVTAYDARDVEPLVEALRSVEAVGDIAAVRVARAALAAFEEEGSDG